MPDGINLQKDVIKKRVEKKRARPSDQLSAKGQCSTVMGGLWTRRNSGQEGILEKKREKREGEWNVVAASSRGKGGDFLGTQKGLPGVKKKKNKKIERRGVKKKRNKKSAYGPNNQNRARLVAAQKMKGGLGEKTSGGRRNETGPEVLWAKSGKRSEKGSQGKGVRGLG